MRKSPNPPVGDTQDAHDLRSCPHCKSSNTHASSSPGANMPDGSRVLVHFRKCDDCGLGYKGTSTIVTRKQQI